MEKLTKKISQWVFSNGPWDPWEFEEFQKDLAGSRFLCRTKSFLSISLSPKNGSGISTVEWILCIGMPWRKELLPMWLHSGSPMTVSSFTSIDFCTKFVTLIVLYCSSDRWFYVILTMAQGATLVLSISVRMFLGKICISVGGLNQEDYLHEYALGAAK